jgi:hypothetical protein
MSKTIKDAKQKVIERLCAGADEMTESFARAIEMLEAARGQELINDDIEKNGIHHCHHEEYEYESDTGPETEH